MGSLLKPQVSRNSYDSPVLLAGKHHVVVDSELSSFGYYSEYFKFLYLKGCDKSPTSKSLYHVNLTMISTNCLGIYMEKNKENAFARLSVIFLIL